MLNLGQQAHSDDEDDVESSDEVFEAPKPKKERFYGKLVPYEEFRRLKIAQMKRKIEDHEEA